jgi:hypothetical protein
VIWRGRAQRRAARALEQAEREVQDGRALDAIASLTSANRALHDARLEQRLVEVRHQAYGQLDRRPGRPDWPPSFPDRFGSADTIPDAAPADLTGDLIGSAITHQGALRVRGLVGRDDVEHLVAGIDRAFEARDRWVDDSSARPPWFVPFVPTDPEVAAHLSRKFAVEAGAVWTGDSPRLLFELLDLYETIGLRAAAQDYLGERPAVSLRKCTLRRVPPDLDRAAWHQDGAFLGADVRSLNVWLALSECGGGAAAPGLELVPRRLDRVLETGTTGTYLPWAVSPLLVDELVEQTGTPTVRPHFDAGDALLFDDRFLHRTGVAGDLSRPRYALETWLFAPSSYPDDQIPLVF